MSKYKVEIWGRGGSIVIGKVSKKIVKHCDKQEINLAHFAKNKNSTEIPDVKLQPFPPGDWRTCNNIDSQFGADVDEYSTLSVTDETGTEVYSGSLGGESIDLKVNTKSSVMVPDGEYIFTGQTYARGCLYKGTIETMSPFNKDLLSVEATNSNGRILCNEIKYDGTVVNSSGETDANEKDTDFQLAESKTIDDFNVRIFC